MYIFSYILVLSKERQLQLYEIKMTCTDDLHHIMAYRMLYFGFFNRILNSVMIFILNSRGLGALQWRYTAISFLAIFLFGIMALLM